MQDRRFWIDKVHDRIRLDIIIPIIVCIALPGIFLFHYAYSAWDATKPATGAALSSADIRANWEALEDALNDDHNFSTNGEHKKVTLIEQASDPTNAANKGFVYTKDDGGDTELYYEDDSGNVAQITSDGYLLQKLFSTNAITSADSPYSMTANDTIIEVDSSGADITVNLQSAASAGTGRILTINHSTPAATANDVNIAADGTDTINGLAGLGLFTGRESITFSNNGSDEWYIISKYLPLYMQTQNDVTVTGTTDETNLMIKSIPAYVIRGGLKVIGAGTISAVGGAKTVKIYLGSSSVTICNAVAKTGDWVAKAYFTWMAGTSFEVDWWFIWDDGTSYAGFDLITGPDRTTALDVKFSGELAVGTDAILQENLIIERYQ
jgi:hypothetical protein